MKSKQKKEKMSNKSEIVTESEMMLDPSLGPIVAAVIDFTTRVITDHFLLIYEANINSAYFRMMGDTNVSDPITKRKIIESAIERLVSELQERGVDPVVGWLGKNEKNKVETTEKPIIRRQGEVIPHTPVVMESSGKVIPITPIPPPTAMVAQSGEFAKNTKHSVTQTDVDNDGNFVITTSTVRIVKVGTPEYISMVKLAFQKKNKAEAV